MVSIVPAWGQLSKRPDMPLMPLRKGPLTGTVAILDPGHGGSDPGAAMGGGRYESAYTMWQAMELATLLRKKGATVYFTTWSETVHRWHGKPNQVIPLPRDAVFMTTGEQVNCTKDGLRQRVRYSQKVRRAKKNRGKLIFFVSLHVDSRKPKGWAGGCVIVPDRDEPNVLGKVMAAKMLHPAKSKTTYARRNKRHVVKVLDDRRGANGRKRPLIMRKGVVPQRVLVEMGIPSDKQDSWRLRSLKENDKFFQKVVISALIETRKRLSRH